MEASTQARILHALMPPASAARAAEGAPAAGAAEVHLEFYEFSSISGKLGDDPAALGMALAELEQFHTSSTGWKYDRTYRRRGLPWRDFHLIGFSTDIVCVSGLNTRFLKSFVDKSVFYCFLLVVQGTGTIGGKQVYVGSYMALTKDHQVEVGGGELLTVVLHFLPAVCGGQGQCPEVPAKLQEVLTCKDNGMQECRRARKRWLQHTYDERRRKSKQHLQHELDTEVPVFPGSHEESPCGQDPCHPEQQDGQLGAERTTAPQSAVVKAEERNMDPAATSMVRVSTDHMATGVASERFNEPLRGGCDEISGATRVASEETRVPSQVVHRVWMNIKNGTLDQHGEMEKLPSVAEKSLASFAFGFRQMLWTWQSAPVADRFCHCERRNAQLLMPAEEVRRLLQGGVHVAQIKDIIQMRILFAYGGFFRGSGRHVVGLSNANMRRKCCRAICAVCD
jgi:hypothetical protein